MLCIVRRLEIISCLCSSTWDREDRTDWSAREEKINEKELIGYSLRLVGVASFNIGTTVCLEGLLSVFLRC